MNPSCLASVRQKLQAHLRMRLVSSGFLALPGFLEVVADCPVSFTYQEVIADLVDDGLVVQENAHRNHDLHHRSVPIAIGSRIKIFDNRIPYFANHRCEFQLVVLGPSGPRVLDQFGSDDKVIATHPDQ